MNILDIGKFLSKLFGEIDINVYPIIAENSANLPFATYERVGTTHQHKDKQISSAQYSITILSEQYDKSVDLVQRLIDACRKTYSFEDTIIRLTIESSNESYNDCYIQNVTLTIELN
jgi:hypothetical protein